MPMNPVQAGISAAPALGRLERFALAWKAKILLLFGLQSRANQVFEDILRRAPHDVYALNSLGYAALQRRAGRFQRLDGFFLQTRNPGHAWPPVQSRTAAAASLQRGGGVDSATSRDGNAGAGR